MKLRYILLWVVGCVAVGIGGALWYINRPSAVETRNENYALTATPKPSASLVSKSFTNRDHKYTLKFYSDAVVVKGALAAKAGQEAILARPGHTATSFVVLAAPIDDAHDSQRSDCGSRANANVAFTVNVSGQTVSVCRASAQPPYAIYTLDVRSTGTWEQVTFFDNALADLTPYNANIKTILGSLVID